MPAGGGGGIWWLRGLKTEGTKEDTKLKLVRARIAFRITKYSHPIYIRELKCEINIAICP